MGNGDSRNSPKMRRLKAQRRLKQRIKRRRVTAAAARAQHKTGHGHADRPAASHAQASPTVKQREKKTPA
jgi:hypothetical protein